MTVLNFTIAHVVDPAVVVVVPVVVVLRLLLVPASNNSGLPLWSGDWMTLPTKKWISLLWIHKDLHDHHFLLNIYDPGITIVARQCQLFQVTKPTFSWILKEIIVWWDTCTIRFYKAKITIYTLEKGGVYKKYQPIILFHRISNNLNEAGNQVYMVTDLWNYITFYFKIKNTKLYKDPAV